MRMTRICELENVELLKNTNKKGIYLGIYFFSLTKQHAPSSCTQGEPACRQAGVGEGFNVF